MKKITLITVLLIIMMATTVFATTEVTMEIVEDNICKIDINDECTFEKRIVDSNIANHQVTLQLKIANNSKVVIPSGELILVIDSSNSMNQIVEGEKTRKDIVLNSANKLIESLLAANSTSLKIGVVTFSSSSEKNEDGFLITGTASDSQKICDLTNDLSVLTNKVSSIEGTGQYTNLDSGLKLAKSLFSNDNTKKYMIVLTDGLPNLAVGYNDLVSYKGLTDVITQTKSTLSSLDGVELITMLTGIDNEEAILKSEGTNSYTYGQVITEVFGTEESPTKGTFYKIDDKDIEQTITNKICQNLLPIETSLENITVFDYFPNYITKNFDITLHDTDLDIKIMTDNENRQYIEWKLEKLSPNESKIIKYDITLKETFDTSIIDTILDTNEKVDITYKNFDGTDKLVTSDITPKIRLIDNTVAPTVIPAAGSPMFPFLFIIILGITLFSGYKIKHS